MSNADRDGAADVLSAQMLAVGTLLTHVLNRLREVNPDLGNAISRAFDDASDGVEQSALQVGEPVSSKRAAEALRIIETLRAATVGQQKKQDI
jgi:hypothetical protein